MSIIKQAIQIAQPHWKESLSLPFLQEMKEGTLSKDQFDHYFINDIAYLFQYVKLCGHAISNATTAEEISLYLSLISVSFDMELNHRYLLQDEHQNGITEETKNYIHFMRSFQVDDDNRRLFLALLQCMLSYQYVFTQMAKEIEEITQHPYYFFIKDYIGDFYTDQCEHWKTVAEKNYQKLSDEEEKEVLQIFLEGSQMEYGLWRSLG